MADYIFTDTPVNPELLSSEITASAIVNVLDSISVTGGDDTTITFTGTLSGGDEALLNSLVASHDSNIDDGVGVREDIEVDSVAIDKEKINFVGFNVSETLDTITVQNPSINMFYGYSTSNSVLTTTFLQVPINVEGIKDSIYVHAANSPDVQVTKTSRYKIMVEYNADAASTARSSSECAIFINGSQLDESLCYGYHRTTNQGEDTGKATVPIELNANDIISVGVREINGNIRLRTPTSMRITIEEKL